MSAAPKIDFSQWTEADARTLFRSFPLFKGFPEILIDQLATAVEFFRAGPGVEVLKQGQMNEHLFLLVEGEVGVYVDGGKVSQLNRPGDLLGEMSVITNNPVGATILSETEVILARIDSRIFLNMQGPERDLYLSTLYRIYSVVLAEKLDATNHKAKHFEALSKKLSAAQDELREINLNLEKKVEERTQKLEQQNVELMASKNKMEDLINTKQVVFRKLSQLHVQQMGPLKAHLDQFRRVHPDDTVVNELRTAVFDLQILLGPLINQFTFEQEMRSKKVLLADTNKKQQVIAKMALGGTGVILDIVNSAEEGKAKLSGGSYDLLIFDAPCVELANVVADLSKPIETVLMTSDEIPSYLPALKSLKVMPQIVSRNELDRTFTVKNITTTITKLLSEDFFGLEKYLSWGVEVNTLPITSSKGRPEIIANVLGYFEKLGIRRANRDRMQVVLEEMLMNAIYDAPTDQNGKSKYNHLDRTVDFSLKAEEQGMVRFASDGVLAAVSVQDPFGSLNGSTILKYLDANYGGGVQDLNRKEGKGGAGRGLHQIVENSDLVVFNVEPKVKTEVIALFNIEVKEAIDRHPSFHLFFKINRAST